MVHFKLLLKVEQANIVHIPEGEALPAGVNTFLLVRSTLLLLQNWEFGPYKVDGPILQFYFATVGRFGPEAQTFYLLQNRIGKLIRHLIMVHIPHFAKQNWDLQQVEAILHQ